MDEDDELDPWYDHPDEDGQKAYMRWLEGGWHQGNYPHEGEPGW